MSRKTATTALLSVSVIGGMSVHFAGHEIKLSNRKEQGLLAFLCLEASACSRDELVGRFWSDAPENKARASLRQTLYVLNRELSARGYKGLAVERFTVEIDRRTLQLDLHEILNAAEVEHRAHPLLLETSGLSEMLLAGYDHLDPSFQDWLRAKRQIVHDRIVRGLETGLRDEKFDSSHKMSLAQAILNLDATHEEACRYLMRARAEAGDLPGALRAYKALWDLLEADYDMEPSAATQQLVADIKSGAFESTLPKRQPQPKPVAATVGKIGKISLAIEPFSVDGVSEENVYLVHGFRHHLAASLVKFREWYVTDRAGLRGSMARSNGDRATGLGFTAAQPPDPSQYNIQATAFQTDTAVKLVVTLKQIYNDIYLWSHTFELGLEHWFDTQQNVVRRIATALNVNISQERLNRLSAQADVSLDAYDRWLRGQATIIGFRTDKWRSAEKMFRDTIRAAPNFSPAYSSLAQINNLIHIVQPGVYRNREREQETIELGKLAVRHDPLDSRAHLCLGWAYMMAKQYDHAPTQFDLACDLNDSDPWTAISASLAYSFIGSSTRAQDLARRSLDSSLVPSPAVWGYEATSCFMRGDYEGCIEAARRASDVILNLPAWTAAAMFHLGQHDMAREEARKFIDRVRPLWQGSQPVTETAIANWALHLFPIANRSDWERLRDGLVGAGLPNSDMDHHAW
jgi:DNA-binding SARP family transcriptional activator